MDKMKKDQMTVVIIISDLQEVVYGGNSGDRKTDMHANCKHFESLLQTIIQRLHVKYKMLSTKIKNNQIIFKFESDYNNKSAKVS